MTDTYRTVNPATGEALREFPRATDEAVAAAVDGAAQRYRAWRTGPVGERTAVLAGAAAAYRERADELATLVATEMGKPVAQARGEIAITADIYDYYAEHAEEFLRDRPLPVTGGGSALVRLEPTGVLLGIMPWNYPHYQVARFAAPNLALGNTVLVKHAPNCPQSALAVQEILTGAGLPEGPTRTCSPGSTRSRASSPTRGCRACRSPAASGPARRSPSWRAGT